MMEGEDLRPTGEDDRNARRKFSPPTAGPGGCELWDLGGTGDCGYRVLSAMRGQKRAPESTKEEIQKLVVRGSKACKAQVVSYLSRSDNSEWKKEWKIDPDETAKTLGGQVPENADKWLEAVQMRPEMWMDWRCILAIASSMELRAYCCGNGTHALGAKDL